jgi:hypothetical protein
MTMVVTAAAMESQAKRVRLGCVEVISGPFSRDPDR